MAAGCQEERAAGLEGGALLPLISTGSGTDVPKQGRG